MSNFEYIAAARYPLNSDKMSNRDTLQMRSDYIASLRECKVRPVYFAKTVAGDMSCSCEPLTIDDTKGWQTVKAHGYKTKKTRGAKQEYTEIYEIN